MVSLPSPPSRAASAFIHRMGCDGGLLVCQRPSDGSPAARPPLPCYTLGTRQHAERGRSALPAPLGDGEAATGQAALFARVREHLAALAAARPLVLLLDDLHWADPASLDLLRVVGRGLAASPILLLAAYRAEELT